MRRSFPLALHPCPIFKSQFPRAQSTNLFVFSTFSQEVPIQSISHFFFHNFTSNPELSSEAQMYRYKTVCNISSEMANISHLPCPKQLDSPAPPKLFSQSSCLSTQHHLPFSCLAQNPRSHPSFFLEPPHPGAVMPCTVYVNSPSSSSVPTS